MAFFNALIGRPRHPFVRLALVLFTLAGMALFLAAGIGHHHEAGDPHAGSCSLCFVLASAGNAILPVACCLLPLALSGHAMGTPCLQRTWVRWNDARLRSPPHSC